MRKKMLGGSRSCNAGGGGAMMGGMAEPATTIEYAAIPHAGRPAVVTALGIVSIVVAGLGLLASLATGLSWVSSIYMSTTFAGGGGGFAATVTTPAGTITAADADVIVASLDAYQPMPTGDQTALAAALPKLELPLTPPADGNWTRAHVDPQITGASIYNFGGGTTRDYNTGGGSIDLNAGTVSATVWNGPNGMTSGTVAADGTVAAGAGPGGPFVENAFGPAWLAWAGLAGEAVSVVLAGLLLAAGIVTLRGSARGRSLHRLWAWPKLAVGVASLAALIAWAAMSESYWMFQGPGGPGWTSLSAVLPWAVPTVLGLAYAVAVLIVLRTRAARAYYE